MDVINLVVATSCVSWPSLAPVLEPLSQSGALAWLAEGTSAKPPVSGIVNDGRLTLLIAPPDYRLPESADQQGVLRVFERQSSDWRDHPRALVVDGYSQLALLAALPKYPALSRLLKLRHWTADQFKAEVLRHHGAAVEALHSKRVAAVFGAQRLGERVRDALKSSGIEVVAFIDNSPAKQNTVVGGIPVLSLSQLTDKGMPIVIATTRFSTSIARQLQGDGFSNFLPYSVMSLLDEQGFPDEIPYVGIQQDFAEHAHKYLELFLSLADDKSRRVLDGLIHYRMQYDSHFAADVADEYARQYFDADLIRFSGEDVFVDLGGYDGDTAEKFIEFSGGAYRRIYLFEPDENLLERAASRLQNHGNIEFVPAGAYSSDGELRFAASGRTNGAISDAGELVVPVRMLDSVVRERPTLIKMDIEGAETDALRGASKLIRQFRPKLAIAAYHYGKDLWRLPDVVRDIEPGYRFYLRHYSETGLESVIYAL